MSLNDPAYPVRDSDAGQIGGPPPAAPIEMAQPGSAHDEPCAAQETRAREPGAGQGDVAAAAGRQPQAAEESQDEPPVSGDDDEDLPAARVTAAGATADPVEDYLGQIGKMALLNAGQEVELAKQIEAGLFAEQKLAEGSRNLSADVRIDLEQVAEDDRRAKNHLLEANLRLVVSLARRYTGRGMPFLDLIQEDNSCRSSCFGEGAEGLGHAVRGELASKPVVYAAECHVGRQRGPDTQAAQPPGQRRCWLPMWGGTRMARRTNVRASLAVMPAPCVHWDT